MAIEITADLAATTYADVAAARAAADIRRGPVLAAIEDLSDDDLLAGLTARTTDIDTLQWIGDRATAEQALEWPRTDAEDSNGTEYSDDAWPTRLVNAVIEQTFADAVAGTIGATATVDPVNPSTTAPNIKRETVGPLTTEYFAPPATATDIGSLERFAPIVQNLLRPLLRSTAVADASTEWGTGCSYRAS